MHDEDKGGEAMTDAQLAATSPGGGPATLFADLLAGLDATPDEPVDATPAAATVSRVIRCTADLESSAHLSGKVALMWGSPDLDVFIRSLFMDSRDGERRGLPAEMAAELMFLAKTNKVRRAMDAVKKLGLSFPEALRLIDEADDARSLQSQRRTAPPESVVRASRQKAAQEGFFAGLLRGNFVIFLMCLVICGLLFWILAR